MEIKIQDITQEIIQDVINQDSKIHSPKTVRNNHGLISAVLKQERANLYIPSDDEIKKIMECVRGTEMELPILLAAFGPMPRVEICALCKHISGNIVHAELNMVLDLNNNWIIKPPKSYAGDRYIEYPDFIAEKCKGITGKNHST